MKKLLLIFLLISGLATQAWATHNRAGEITYRHISGLTYEIIITTYTKIEGPASSADRCELEIFFGDGTSDTIQRVNGPIGPCGNAGSGEVIATDIKKNIYIAVHTFPGPFRYTITMEDPNRNDGILNINNGNSVNTPFFLQSTLLIDPRPEMGPNTSPVLLNAPIDEGCLFQSYFHSPGAVDPDGDSLVYSLTVCLGSRGVPLPNYEFPNQVNPGSNNQITIDPKTGILDWSSPQTAGEYNVCILIEEYRNGELIGTVQRDMQITISTCMNNPPVILPMDAVCVEAGQTVDVPVKAYDEDGQIITLTGTGAPFLLTDGSLTFMQPAQGRDTVEENFTWQTSCNHVRNQPYLITFRAEDDDGDAMLVDYESLEIQVVAPAPQNELAEPRANSIELTWDPSLCTNATGYKIYRNVDSLGYDPPECVTGVPGATGYQLIGTTQGLLSTEFIDDNNGLGLFHGQRYCYMIVACFADGAESYPTAEVCAQLRKDVPIITRVSVNVTDQTSGADTIEWFRPTEIDTVNIYPGPYRYRIFGRTVDEPNFQLLQEFPSETLLSQTATVFVAQDLNTLEEQHEFYLELFSGQDLVGTTHRATSVFLTSTPFDNALELTWTESVPWINEQYEVYRENLTTLQFELLATVDQPFYRDEGLVNLQPYRYFVRSIGKYSSDGLPQPLLNNSQIHTGIPEDNEPPCPPPNPTIDSECEIGGVELTWENPNDVCPETDDVIYYRIYRSTVLGQPYALFDSTASPDQLIAMYDTLTTVAGCYAVTAIDSFGNESAFSQPLCIDNCPIYELPNVFTPGGDGVNDFFRPFPYRHVERIDLTIFNRWGQEVFKTTDPDIMWDGRESGNLRQVSEGVYFYSCIVYEQRLEGVVPRELKGNVQIINQANFNPNRD